METGLVGIDDVATLLAAPDPAARLAILTSTGPIDEHRLNELLDRAEDRVHSNPGQAETLSSLVDTAADAEANGTDWPGLQARARYQRARILADRGELGPALLLIDQARHLWEASGEPLAALRTDLGRMQILEDLGRHQDAIAVGQNLIATVEHRPDATDALAGRIRAHAMDNLGAAYGYTGDHDRALEAYAAARAAYVQLGLDEEAARPLANRAVELLALGRPREAMADLLAANEVFLAADDLVFAAQCQGDLATAHRQLGEFSVALAILEQARRSLDELGAHAEADRLRLALAETYLALSLFPEARAAAAESADWTAKAGMVHDHGHAQLLLGLSYLASGDASEADAHLARAEAAYQDVADRQHLARTGLARAKAAGLAGRFDDAIAAAERAAVALEAGGWLPSLAWSYLRRLDWTDDPRAIEPLLARACELVDHLRLPNLSFAYELRRARWLRRCGEPARAEAALRGAVAELDRASAALTDYVVRAAFRADRAAAYDELVDLLLDSGDVEQAGAMSDLVKSRTLLELRDQAVGSGPQLAAGDSELTSAYADLTATYGALHLAADAPTRLLLRDRADALERAVSSLRLRHAALGGAPSVQTPAPAIPLNAQTESAGASLAFHVLGADIVAFTGRPGSVRAHRIVGGTAQLAELLDALSLQWSRRARPSRGPHQELVLLTATRRTLGDIYDLLLRPLRSELDAAEADLMSELRVVPHGLVGQVPFRALFDGEGYLLDRFAVTVTPTLGPSVAQATAGRPALVVSVADDAIPAADDEAARVATVLAWGDHSVRLLSGEWATAAGASASMAGAGIVHLACHAIFRPENPLFSRLRLADRWLTASEIVQLDLPATLVTVSACDSGRADSSAEPIGLGWAFLAAGAAGVIVSQWAVDDETARELMVRFYEELETGAAPSTALRRAQLHIAVDRPHPYFWAPFTYLSSSSARAEPPIPTPNPGGNDAKIRTPD